MPYKKLTYVAFLALSLFFAGCSSNHKPAPVVDVQGSIPLSKRLKSSLKGREYIVKKGETLYSIAWRANVDINRLAMFNNLASPYRIFPGQKLFLVKNSAQASNHIARVEKQKNKKPIRVKKPVASNKKQAYGKNVREQKVNNKTSANGTTFSQKIRTWLWPAKGKVIEGFSTAKQGNKGINIAGTRGDSVKSTANGVVVYAGDALRGYGRLIIVKHNDDYLSAYAHNESILVKEQQLIKAGQVIAKMGDTDAERVMLHFEVRFRGKSVNPMKYLSK
ncbi:peptidoglycan DD-metalloendopeptidase family protein [Colwellia sp. MB3u-28]|nr:peptidoglycan DD-metalloendopeptidase family protein [Colwellia sp. MB02u-7]MBA6238295.1 peptidoglycan DD-metalloendopeptidase family protein [Colwellia sp. MB02u-11]MBA6254545.1 peptidoglycan DD-metalloendopeptidase family protein [Colwellia sp. MB3u-28]MBA6258284.1 peptidoglycan DD-metalloendopeptidase family protein [Colwellia sp. MB3u-41]MBA6301045.1 peptidoglycan DD-metalloendopeptidase family protein [Colwellia sp. MB3u-22]MBA6310023.1 peptidoglycan DD-metalloendopeptidase family prot